MVGVYLVPFLSRAKAKRPHFPFLDRPCNSPMRQICCCTICRSPITRAGLSAAPEYLPPVPAQHTRDRPTARGVKLPWPGLATPQAYTTEMRVNVMTTSQPKSCARVMLWSMVVGSKQPGPPLPMPANKTQCAHRCGHSTSTADE
jgi:hypothetical protein